MSRAEVYFPEDIEKMIADAHAAGVREGRESLRVAVLLDLTERAHAIPEGAAYHGGGLDGASRYNVAQEGIRVVGAAFSRALATKGGAEAREPAALPEGFVLGDGFALGAATSMCGGRGPDFCRKDDSCRRHNGCVYFGGAKGGAS